MAHARHPSSLAVGLSAAKGTSGALLAYAGMSQLRADDGIPMRQNVNTPLHLAGAEAPSALRERRVALVLGGGGLKGFAHIGALRALAERGVVPSVIAGTSIGALIAAAHVTGLPLDEMERRALALRRRDMLRLDHLGMLMDRWRATSIYLAEPLRALIDGSMPAKRFDEVGNRLLVNTVDLQRGTQVVWGLPGLRDVPIADAVYASCALPGYFPPGQVGGRVCVDGGVIDNLPVQVAAVDADVVIAIDVGSSDLAHISDIARAGFAQIYMRSATTMMHALQQWPLGHWDGPPMLLVRPRLGDVGWMTFGETERTIAEGYRACSHALEAYEECLSAPGGIYPRRAFELTVDRTKCIGCTLCVALAPSLMGMDGERKAFPRARVVDWSPSDGEFVHHCPTNAIIATKIGRPGALPADSTPARGVATG